MMLDMDELRERIVARGAPTVGRCCGPWPTSRCTWWLSRPTATASRSRMAKPGVAPVRGHRVGQVRGSVTSGLAFVVIRADAAPLESFRLAFVVMRAQRALVTTSA